MWRSDCESRILNTYVPAGSTPHPARWTPGISTGALNVITLFLFHSSALAPGVQTAPITARQQTVVMPLNIFILPLFLLSAYKRHFRVHDAESRLKAYVPLVWQVPKPD